ncbi:MAG: hypothetical protein R3C11_23375 [Planctomycetaceae bacterium]
MIATHPIDTKPCHVLGTGSPPITNRRERCDCRCANRSVRAAAEQLDRLHRLGVDKALLNYATTPAPPPPPKKPKKPGDPLHEDLQRLIDQWDAMQAHNSFGRLEIQVGEVRDLIVQLSQTVREQQAMVPQVIQAPAPVQQLAQPVEHTSHPDFEDGNVELPDNLFQENQSSVNPQDKYAAGGEYSNWDSIKRSMLGDPAAPTASGEPAPQMDGSAAAFAEHSQVAPGGGHSEAEEAAFLAQLAELIPEGLGEVDLDNASHNEVVRALEERDEYISRLLNYITAVHKLDMNWEIIAQGPQALQDRLMNLQSQLEAKLRLAEVSIAVERAKLGRDEMRVRQLESNAQRILKRLGVDPSDPNSMQKVQKMDPSQAAGQLGDQAAGGNWRRLLGLGKEEEDKQP